MTEVLIVRSAPIQQLDANLSEIRAKFDSPTISILSHEHSIELLEKYCDVQECIPYPFEGSFDYRRKAFFGNEKKFDHAIIMVGNLTGVGFQNVLFFALSLPSRKIWTCNLVGELIQVSRPRIILKSLRNQFFKIAALVLSLMIGIVTLPILFLFLIQRSKPNV